MALDGLGSNSGATNEEILEFMREYQVQKRAVDEANGVLRSIVKRAKSAGVNTQAMIATVKLSRQDPDEVRANLREQVRMMSLRNMPVTQMDLFPANFDLMIAPAAKEAEDLFAAEEAGYRAGRNAVPIEDCPYDAGSEAYATWMTYWHRGQAANVQAMADGEEPAPATRSRPRRNAEAHEPPAAQPARGGRKARGGTGGGVPRGTAGRKRGADVSALN